jgi:hypothetical protein
MAKDFYRLCNDMRGTQSSQNDYRATLESGPGKSSKQAMGPVGIRCSMGGGGG